MKVKDASELRSIDSNRGAQESRKRSDVAASAGTERVSTAASAELERAVSQVRTSLGSSRSLRLESIEAAVRQGTFKPDPQRIAQKILDDAELTAELQAILNR